MAERLLIYCTPCKDYRDASHKHAAGFQRPVAAPAPEPKKPYDPDTYVPPWRKGTVSMGDGQGTAPSYNTHMKQVQPRNDTRNPALDEAIKREADKPRKHRSNLIR